MPHHLDVHGYTDPDAVRGVFRFTTGQKLFNNRYELIRELGSGGMGVVWLARDAVEGTEAALKFMPSLLVRQGAELDRLRAEVRTGKELRHPRLVSTYGLEVDDRESLGAIVMEYVAGETLKEKLDRHPRGFFEPEELKGWLGDMAEGLTYLHSEAKRIHRDLKPANVIIGPDNRARLMDFGISHRVQESLTQLSGTPGTGGGDSSSSTLAYASPQQVLGKPASPADDIYSLGATLYELLTGGRPFLGSDTTLLAHQITSAPLTSVRERRRELKESGLYADTGAPVPDGWERAVQRCLAKERKDRWPSAAALMEEIRKVKQSAAPAPPTAQTPAPATAPANPQTAAKPAAAAAATVKLPRKSSGGSGGGAPAGFIILFVAWIVWKNYGAKPDPTPQELADKLLAESRQEQDSALKLMDDLMSKFSVTEFQLSSGSAGSRLSVRPGIGHESISLRYCPPGSFTAGSPFSEAGRTEDEEPWSGKPKGSDTFSKGFWMAETEMTQAQWKTIMLTEPSGFKGGKLPVESINWSDAQKAIEALNLRAKLPLGWKWVLPTGKQWEYACRAGTTTAFSFGPTLSGEQANFDSTKPYGAAAATKDPHQQSMPVGSFPPNAWGLWRHAWERC